MFVRPVIGFLVCAICTGYLFADERQLYFGLLHSHTSYSDGAGTPTEAYRYARDKGKLDFFAITEHNHDRAAGDDGISLTKELYIDLKNAADNITETGRFVAIYGQEYSTISAGNHVNIFNASEICRLQKGDFKTLYESWLPQHVEVPFIQFNHPNFRKDERESTKASQRLNDYGLDDYGEDYAKLVAASASHVALIEMIIGPAFSHATDMPHHNGRHEKDYLFYLNKGFRLGVSVGQDNHNKTWGTATHARLGVWATELSRKGIFDALQNRHCFASEDDNLRLQFKANGAIMGSEIPVSENHEAIRLEVDISDPDETRPDTRYAVRLFYDDGVGGEWAKVIEEHQLTGPTHHIEFRHLGVSGGYYFVKVTQKSKQENNSDDVWSSPIWLGPSAPDKQDHPESEVISWEDANDYVGLEVEVTGKIVRSFDSGRALFLNFDPDYQNTLSLVLLKKHFDAFGGSTVLADQLVNNKIRVRGKITIFRDRLQILLEDPSQIGVVSEDH